MGRGRVYHQSLACMGVSMVAHAPSTILTLLSITCVVHSFWPLFFYKKEETAAIMNAYFINIKVDREERPDVDRVYVSVVGHIYS